MTNNLQGWGVIRFYVMRDEATHVTIVLGTVYLHYSAFFVTIELPYLNYIVKVRLSRCLMKNIVMLGRCVLNIVVHSHSEVPEVQCPTALRQHQACENLADTVLRGSSGA